MRKTNPILKLMMRHHRKIETLIKIFEASLSGNFRLSHKALDKLMWEFEKHMFAEEKAIFRICILNKKVCLMTRNLEKEHKDMKKMLRQFRNNLLTNNRVDISGLKKLLSKHKNFEEESFYPQIDRELSKTQKALIIKRIKEISFPR